MQSGALQVCMRKARARVQRVRECRRVSGQGGIGTPEVIPVYNTGGTAMRCNAMPRLALSVLEICFRLEVL